MESTLTARDGEFILRIGFRRYPTDAERNTAEDGTVLGVDLGVENIAVTSTARFFSGGEMLHRLSEFETVRGGLQRTGTWSAHRTLNHASGRALRYIRDVMHRVANGIIDEALRYDCDEIVFENLTDTRENTWASCGHQWAFSELSDYVEYKAKARDTRERGSVGVHIEAVRGVWIHDRRNRPARDHFRCRTCESEANADYNAVARCSLATAKNIGLQYVRRANSRRGRRATVSLASSLER